MMVKATKLSIKKINKNNMIKYSKDMIKYCEDRRINFFALNFSFLNWVSINVLNKAATILQTSIVNNIVITAHNINEPSKLDCDNICSKIWSLTEVLIWSNEPNNGKTILKDKAKKNSPIANNINKDINLANSKDVETITLLILKLFRKASICVRK